MFQTRGERAGVSGIAMNTVRTTTTSVKHGSERGLLRHQPLRYTAPPALRRISETSNGTSPQREEVALIDGHRLSVEPESLVTDNTDQATPRHSLENT